MIYEIVTPYDGDSLADCHQGLTSLFRALSMMTTGIQPGDQLEMVVLRFESWTAREKAIADPDYDSSKYVVLNLDEL